MRLSTGIPGLDARLGGGLLPGTLTVVAGATGIGKSQLGLHWAGRGREDDGAPGIVVDLTSRGDSQNHDAYARRLEGRTLRPYPLDRALDYDAVWPDASSAWPDCLHLFDRSGRKPTRHDLDEDEWREWKVELSRKLEHAIAFCYGNFIRGVRRVVVDGVEPADDPRESFQFHVIEYLYHQVLRKDHDWLARDLFRAGYRARAERVAAHAYDASRLSALVLYTTHEVMLDDLIGRPLESGDLLSNANTIICMGKVRENRRLSRALYVAKHRGSACQDDIVPFEITDAGLRIGD